MLGTLTNPLMTVSFVRKSGRLPGHTSCLLQATTHTLAQLKVHLKEGELVGLFKSVGLLYDGLSDLLLLATGLRDLLSCYGNVYI